MLYSEEVQGFPEQRILTLRCEFFGLAGHYALRLKPANANSSAPTTSAYIKVISRNCINVFVDVNYSNIDVETFIHVRRYDVMKG